MTEPVNLAYRRTYRLSCGFTVEFVLDGSQMTAIWDPHLPRPKVGRKLLPAYQRARDQFIASLGVPALVVEL